MTAVNYLAPWSAPTPCVTGSPHPHPPGSSRSPPGLVDHTIDPSLDLTDTADFTRIGSSPRYGRSKLMDIMFTQELGRRLHGTGVAVTCCCPGFNATGLGRELPLASALERALTALGVGNPRRGADIIVRLATRPSSPTVPVATSPPGPRRPCGALRSGEAKRFSVRCGGGHGRLAVHDIRRPHDA